MPTPGSSRRPANPPLERYPVGMRRLASIAWTACLLLAACGSDSSAGSAPGGDPAEIDNVEVLQQALTEAQAGDRVQVAAGRYTGSFVVPGGVTLQGAGPQTVFVADGGPALRLQATSAGTSVMRAGVEATAGGVLAKGPGDALLLDLTVTLSGGGGYGVAVVGGRATLRDVVISGQGVAGVIGSGGQLVGERLAIDVDGDFGAVLIDSEATWSDGSVAGALVGVHVEGGQAELSGLVVRDGGGTLGAGVAIVGGAAVTTRALAVSGFDGFGLLQDGAASVHEDLTVQDNGNVGIWSQRGSDVEIRGAGTSVMRNSGAAVYSFESAGLAISGGLFAQTGWRPTVDGVGVARIGDGLQVIDAAGALHLEDAVFEDHPRAGLLMHGGAAGLQATVSGVVVRNTGEGEDAGDAVAIVAQGDAPTTAADTMAAGVDSIGAFAAAGTSVMTVLQPLAGDSVPSGPVIGDNGLLAGPP